MKMRTVLILMMMILASGAVFASEEVGAEEQGIFSGTLADAIWAVVAFVLLLVILTKIAWKPLLKTLQAREDQIRNQLVSAENVKVRAEKLLDEYKEQSLEIIEKATNRANQMEKDALEKAGKAARMMKEQAILEISAAQNRAHQQLWQQVGEIILTINREVLGRSTTTGDDKRLVDEAIAKLKHQQHSGTLK